MRVSRRYLIPCGGIESRFLLPISINWVFKVFLDAERDKNYTEGYQGNAPDHYAGRQDEGQEAPCHDQANGADHQVGDPLENDQKALPVFVAQV